MQKPEQLCGRRHRRLTSAIICVCSALGLALAIAENCFASGFGGEVANIGRIIQTLALSGGAVGLAWSGIEFAVGDDKKAGKAKTRMIYIIVAAAAVYALPAVIRTAKVIFESTGWSPK